MNLAETPLDQIGSAADGHYRAAEKAAGKAEEHYRSAGIYLKHAKLRVLKTRGLTWPRWLADHCPIGRRRADEVIAISDGRKTLEESRAANAAANKSYRERQKVTTGRVRVLKNRLKGATEDQLKEIESVLGVR